MNFNQLIALIFIFLSLNLFLITTPDHGFNEDLGRHLTFGKVISETKTVPKTNFFSYTMSEYRAVDSHWLSQVIFYQVYKLGGLKGLTILKWSLINITFAVLSVIGIQALKTRFYLSLPLFAVGILMAKERVDLRPELFTNLLLVLFALILKPKLTWKRVLLLTGLQFLWINLHIMFFWGPILVFLSLFSIPITAVKKKAFQLLPLFLVNLLNPLGLYGAIFPLLIMRDYGYKVLENQTFAFLVAHVSGISFATYYLVILTAVICLILALYLRAWKSFVKITLVLIAALKMFRNFTFLVYIGLPAQFRILKKLLLKWQPAKQQLNLILTTYSLFFIIILTGLLTKRSIISTNNFETWYEGLGAYLDTNQIKGNVFNSFDNGGYLIFKLWPKHQVFIDNRADAYPSTFLNGVFKPMLEDETTFLNAVEKYQIKTIIWPKTDITPRSQYFLKVIMPNLSGWDKAYEDPYSLVLMR